MRKLVIAGNYRQFKNYFPIHDNNVKYISHPFELKGYDNAEIVRVGTWYELPHEFLRQVEEEDAILKFRTKDSRRLKGTGR